MHCTCYVLLSPAGAVGGRYCNKETLGHRTYLYWLSNHQIGNKEIKLGQYADDTFLTLSNSETTISSAVHCIKDFKLISGLAINVEKTQVIKLGEHNSDINCPILNIPYIDKFKLLGINFSTKLQEMDELNF